MSIVLKNGNIFTTTAAAIVHGVNTHGVMGAGIAKTVRTIYPGVYSEYRAICLAGDLLPGEMLAVFGESALLEFADRWILNAASQEAPGANASYELVESSLAQVFDWLDDSSINTVAIPRIGAGIGGLEWEKVFLIMENFAEENPAVTVEVWTYSK